MIICWHMESLIHRASLLPARSRYGGTVDIAVMVGLDTSRAYLALAIPFQSIKHFVFDD